ncbi:MAG: M36 family metallopeptidase [Saprospiraceae bacterium]
MKNAIFLIFLMQFLSAQSNSDQIQKVLCSNYPIWNKAEYRVQSTYYDEILNLTHYYIQEIIQGNPVYPFISNIHLNKDQKVIHAHIEKPCFDKLIKTSSRNIKSTQTLITSYLKTHQVFSSFEKIVIRTRKNPEFVEYELPGKSKSKLSVQECYYMKDNVLHQSLRMILERNETAESWDAFVEVQTGEVLDERNANLNCGIDIGLDQLKSNFSLEENNHLIFSNSCYRVFPIPIESPYHGSRSLINSPWMKATNASPLGWHNDGQFNYKSSEGNNVDAYEDMDGDNLPTGGDAARAFGGVNLNFDFSYDTSLTPPLNKNSSITNLFYWNNIMHDVWYQYGFTEAAGNFQYNNFNKGGLDLDNVIAEGLDNINGSRNNANYSCPQDGFPGRMQMYAWQVPTYDTLTVESPVVSKMVVVHSAISPILLAPLSGEIILVNDGSGFPTQACNNLINGLQLNGKIALLDKGICNLNSKIINCQFAGAIAMIVCNVDDNEPSVMGGFSSGVGIPIVNISKQNGDLLKSYLNQQVNITLLPSSAYKYKANGKSYIFARAAFGGKIPNVFTNNIKVMDGLNNLNDACDPILSIISGGIALIENGNCEPSYKALQAQLSGAIAVVIGMNTSGNPISLPTGTYGSMVTIPVICIGQSDYQEILNNLPSIGRFSNTLPQLVDADFDGGIIAHEYTHGISIRLTGGPNNNTCLTNAEQGGEGWSDYFALAMTMKASDIAYQNRGIGTWPSRQSNIAVGIRPYPYQVDMNINPVTYGSLLDQVRYSIPHGVGFIWCTMIWDMTWALIKQYGFEPDIYLNTSNRGNIKAFNLIMSGLKIQVCNPGFVDARNAILKADTILNGGVNACIIWNVFARRGLGFSANQGSPFLRDDGVQAFNLPPTCLPMTEEQLFGISTLDNSFVKLFASVESDHIQLEWNYQTQLSIEHIEIIRKLRSSPEQLIYSTSKIINSYNDDQISKDQTYYYKVKLFDSNNQIIESNWASASLGSGQNWKLYPNPANSEIFIEHKFKNHAFVLLELFDVNFKKIDQNEFVYNEKDRIKLSIGNLAAGIYFVSIIEEGETKMIKFVKE